MNKVGRMGNLLERFLKKVNKTDGCWLWTGCVAGRYGLIRDNHKGLRAHRVSHQLFKGPTPSDLEVMHTCDNPVCVNPEHLVLGTHTDNMRDMFKKNRRKNKLTSEQREAIANSEGTHTSVAKQHGVSESLVRRYRKSK